MSAQLLLGRLRTRELRTLKIMLLLQLLFLLEQLVL